MTIYWAPFIHAYQPPWQEVEVLKQIYNECYDPLLTMLERHENAKMTINVQGCLVDQLNGLDLKNVGERLTNLMHQGRVDLVGSAKYHPILPLIPKSEVIHQIDINAKTIHANFDGDWHPEGFFPPEMAVSNDIVKIVGELNFKWILMDGIAHKGPWPQNFIPTTPPLAGNPDGIATLFRDTYISNMISFNNIDANGFIRQLLSMFPEPTENPEANPNADATENSTNNDYYMITAQDAETFGHHIKYYETKFLGKAFSLIEDIEEIEVALISDVVKHFPKQEQPPNNIKASSWSTNSSDLASNVPYPLWSHPLNPVHKFQYRMLKALYRLMDLVEAEKPSHKENENFMNYYRTARYFYDESLHSCWLWWASMRPMWSPNLVYKGLDLVNRTAMNAQLALINLKIGTGDEFYSIIVDNGEKIMSEIMEQELAGQHVRTYNLK